MLYLAQNIIIDAINGYKDISDAGTRFVILYQTFPRNIKNSRIEVLFKKIIF